MKKETYKCDIQGEHTEEDDETITRHQVPVMFDHDQEDGKSKTVPYFEMKMLDMCDRHFDYMTENREIIYAYGAMGYNTYSLKF